MDHDELDCDPVCEECGGVGPLDDDGRCEPCAIEATASRCDRVSDREYGLRAEVAT